MNFNEGWTSVEVPDIKCLSGPVMLRSQMLPAHHVFPLHSHRWNQFVYATMGTLVVTVEDCWYVITPEQAIWVPTGVMHTTGALHGAEFRNLYVADQPAPGGMPRTCTVFTVVPLLRALILELVALEGRDEEKAYVNRVNQLILDQLRRLPVQNLRLPWPRSPQLRKVCEILFNVPADSRGLDEWGFDLGV